MVVSDLDVFEHSKCILGQYGGRAIERDQIGSDRIAIDAHKTYGKAWSLFTCQTWLEQAYHSLFLLAGAQQQDIGLSRGIDAKFVGGNEGDAPPGQKWGTEEDRRGRRNSTPRALAPEGRDGARMFQKESRFFPDERE